MTWDWIGFYIFVLLAISLIGYWIERIVIKTTEQKKCVTTELFDNLIRSFQNIYDYLTEEVNE